MSTIRDRQTITMPPPYCSGGMRPSKSAYPSQDFKGYVIEAFTAIRSFTGLKGALKAMKITEDITNRYYGEVVSWQAPAEGCHWSSPSLIPVLLMSGGLGPPLTDKISHVWWAQPTLQ